MAKFQRAGIQPFGVNPAGVDAHHTYATKLNFNFPLLSDPDRAIARAYRALKDDGQGIQRSVYVVRRDGTIAFAQDRKSTRLNSSHLVISYAVFCLKKKKKKLVVDRAIQITAPR